MWWSIGCGSAVGVISSHETGTAHDSDPTGQGDSDADADADSDADVDADADVDTAPPPPPVGPMLLCINEFMPANVASWPVEDLHPDWIELHNPGRLDVSLDGWSMSDDSTQPDLDHIDGSLIVPAGGFTLLLASGDDTLGPNHLSFSLAEGGEDVVLQDADGRVSVVAFGPVAPDWAVERTTNCCEGDGCLDAAFGGTPGTSNN